MRPFHASAQILNQHTAAPLPLLTMVLIDNRGVQGQRSSTAKVPSLLYVALDINHIETNEVDRLYKLADEVASRLGGLVLYLRRRS